MWPTAWATTAVAKFDKNGKFVKSWGSRGLAPGQFNKVHGIAIDAQGTVYVADSGNMKNSGLRRRRNLQDAVPQCRDSGGDLHHAWTTAIPLRLEFKPSERYRRRRRDLQDGFERASSSAGSAKPGSC